MPTRPIVKKVARSILPIKRLVQPELLPAKAEKPEEAKLATSAKNKSVSDRWTEKLVEGGFTPVSDYFLDNYSRLSPAITHGEAMFIIHLMMHKWDAGSPRPALGTIARRMGLTEVSVRSFARNLEKKGFLIRRMRRGKPNYYRLQPLFNALEAHMQTKPPQPLSEDELEAIEASN